MKNSEADASELLEEMVPHYLHQLISHRHIHHDHRYLFCSSCTSDKMYHSISNFGADFERILAETNMIFLLNTVLFPLNFRRFLYLAQYMSHEVGV